VVDIYTDGGCSGNPGPGAWAYVIRASGLEIEDSGFEPATTNNRMELSAVIAALRRVEGLPGLAPGGIAVHTDSQYVKNGITQWIKAWKRNGWRTADKDPVKNRELWEVLDALDARLGPSWHWVKGHAGDELNERCDALLGERIKRGS
jgi:ribonuclease HI